MLVNSTQLATQLTRNLIDPFKNDLFWPATQLTRKPNWPDPTRPTYFAMSNFECLYQPK